MRIRIPLFIAACLVAPPAGAEIDLETREIRLKAEIIADDLHHPWGMAQLPDGSFLVTERRGRLIHLRAGERVEIGNLPDIAAFGQGGLLDLALDPEFAENRRLFFTWSEAGAGGTSTALSAAILPAGSNRLEEVTTLFSMQPKTRSGHHYGSRIVISPDGKLFMTMGDRGDRDRAQDFNDHAGSVIRLNLDGSIPEDNPFLGKPGAMPELWSKGHRNPQGADWNPFRNELWTVEHGAQGGDEINRPQPGLNYGWPVISYGRHYSGAKIGVGTEAPGFEQPLYYWDPSIAPSDMAFYDHDLIAPWKGDLLVGALKYQMLVRLVLENGNIVAEERIASGRFGRIRDVDIFADGAVYLLTDEPDGQLIRLSPAE